MKPIFACLVAMAPCLIASCGGRPVPAAAPGPSVEPTAVASAAPAPPPEVHDDTIPTACADTVGKLCVPPHDFVKRLCRSSFPDVALSMLAKGTPWTRGYLRVKSADVLNSSEDKLIFDEEFVVLTHHSADRGGFQVSGAGGYDVLRWDGTCTSLSDEEVTLKVPPAPKHAKIQWRRLGDKLKAALLADQKLNKAYTERQRECRGATMGDVSLKCVKLDDELNRVIAVYVRGGGTLPAPEKLP